MATSYLATRHIYTNPSQANTDALTLNSTSVAIGASANSSKINMSNGSYDSSSWITAKTGLVNPRKLGTSSTGQYQIAVSGATSDLWLSADTGVTWTHLNGNTGLPTLTGAAYWSSASISATGQYILLSVYGGSLWMSQDYGRTFATTNQPTPDIWLQLNGDVTDTMGGLAATATGSPAYVSVNRPGYSAQAINLANTAGGAASKYVRGSWAGATNFTVSGWFNPQTVNGTFQVVYSSHSTGTEVFINSSNQIVGQFVTGSGYVTINTTFIATINTWYYFTLIHQTNGTCSFYLNNTLIGTTTNYGSFGNYPSTGYYALGIYDNGTTGYNAFNGYIADFRLYNSAITYTTIPLLAPNIWLPMENSIQDSAVVQPIPTIRLKLNGTTADSMNYSTVTPIGTIAYVPFVRTDYTGQAINLVNTAGGTATNYIQSTWTGSPNFTVSFWMNPQTLGVNYQYVFTAYQSLFTVVLNSSNQMIAMCPSGGGMNYTTIGTLSGIVLNTWYFVTVIFQTGGLCSFYVNNTLVGSITNSAGVGTATTSVFELSGIDVYQGAAFNGYIADVCVYNTAIPYTQISSLSPSIWLPMENSIQDQGTSQPNPAIQLLFNGSTSDAMGLSTITTTGSPTYVTFTRTDYTGQAIKLVNPAGGTAAQYVRGTWTGSDNFTVSLWMNPQTLSSGNQHVFNAYAGQFVIYMNSSNQLVYYMYNGVSLTPSFAFTTNTWYFVTAIFQKNGNCSLYVNNNLIGTATNSGGFGGTSSNGFSVACDSSGTNAYNGYLADLRIYNTPLDYKSITYLAPNISLQFDGSIANTGSDANMTVNPDIWLPFNGTTADSMGSTINVTGSVTYVTSSATNTQAVVLANTAGGTATNYIRGPWASYTSQTIAFYFNLQTGSVAQTLFSAYYNGILILVNADNTVSLRLPTGSLYSTTLITSTAVAINTWHYVRVYVTFGSNCYFYLNGSLVGSYGCPGLGSYGTSYAYGIGTTEQGTPTGAFNGYIDDFKIYNRIYGNDAMATGPLTYVTGLSGQAINFTNTSGGQATQFVDYIWQGSSSFTVSFWYNMQNYNNNQVALFTSYNGGLIIMVYPATLSVYAAGSVRISTASKPANNTWHYVRYIHQTNGVCSLYLNNELVGTYTNSGGLGTANKFTLGTYDVPVTHSAFNGYLDNFRLYNGVVNDAPRLYSVGTMTYVPGINNSTAVSLANTAGSTAVNYIFGNISSVGRSSCTFSTRFNVQTLPVSSNSMIVALGGLTQGTYLGLYVTSAGLLTAYFLNSSVVAITIGTMTISTNTWYHAYVVFQTSGTCYLYVNGTQMGSVAGSALYNNNLIYDFTLGRNVANNAVAFNGYIDDFKVYNGAVNEPFTTYSVGTLPYIPGVVGLNALNLVNTAGNGAVNYVNGVWTGSTNFTASFWFNAQTVAAVSQVIFSAYNGGIFVYLNTSQNSINFVFPSGSGAATTYLPASGSITVNTWYHVVITFQSNGACSIYLNGVGASNTNSGGYGGYTSSGIFRLGAYDSNAASAFNGYIDDVKIYNTAIPYHQLQPQNFRAVALSGSGEYALASAASGWVIGGSNTGKTWTKQSVVTGTQGDLIQPNLSGLSSVQWCQNGINWQVTASSSTVNVPIGAFNPSGGQWNTPTGLYSTASPGVYTGSVSTTVLGGVGSISGEWLQIQSSIPLVLVSMLPLASGWWQFPKDYYIVGSNDGLNWYPIQYGVFMTNPLNSTNYASSSTAILVNYSGSQTYTAAISTTVNTTVYSTTATSYLYFRFIYPRTQNGSNTSSDISLVDLYLNFAKPSPTQLALSYSGQYQLVATGSAAGQIMPNQTGLAANTWTQGGVQWTASASSVWSSMATSLPYAAFNNTVSSSITPYSWVSASNYSSAGVYNNTYSTTVLGGIGTVYGEWLQIQASVPLVLQSYTYGCGGFNNLPKNYYIVGSVDGLNWYPLQYVIMTTNPLTGNFHMCTSYITVNTAGSFTISGDTTGSGTSTVYSYTTQAWTYFRVISTVGYSGSGTLCEFGELYLNFQNSSSYSSSYGTSWSNTPATLANEIVAMSPSGQITLSTNTVAPLARLTFDNTNVDSQGALTPANPQATDLGLTSASFFTSNGSITNMGGGVFKYSTSGYSSGKISLTSFYGNGYSTVVSATYTFSFTVSTAPSGGTCSMVFSQNGTAISTSYSVTSSSQTFSGFFTTLSIPYPIDIVFSNMTYSTVTWSAFSLATIQKPTYSNTIVKTGTHSVYFANTAGTTPSVYLNYTVPTVLNTPAALTMACWVYPTAPHPAGVGVMSLSNTATTNNGPCLYWHPTTVGIQIYTTTAYYAEGTYTIPLNTWTHIVGTYNGDVVKIYVNGVELVSNQPPVAVKGPLTTAGGQINNLTIGQAANSVAFQGYVDDARIYTQALSANEIAALYANPALTQSIGVSSSYPPLTTYTKPVLPGAIANIMDAKVSQTGKYMVAVLPTATVTQSTPFARLTLDNTAVDSQGVLVQTTGGATAVTYSTSVKQVGTHSAYFNQTAGFTTPDIYLNYTVPSALNTPSIITMSCWIYPTAIPTSGISVPMAFTNGTTGGTAFYIATNGNAVWAVTTSISGYNELATTVPLVVNNWYHLVGTLSGGVKNFYVNGTLIATGYYTGVMSLQGGGSFTNLVVGAQYSTGTFAGAFAGYIDDVRIHTVALTATEVSALYAGYPTNNNVYYSMDSGATFTGLSLGTSPMVACSMSYDGSYLTATNQAGTIYTLNRNSNTYTLAIGNQAGQTNQGSNAIAIGNKAGQLNQAANSIVLNATGSAVTATTQGFYVSPIADTAGLPMNLLGYGADSQIVKTGITVLPGGLGVNIGTTSNPIYANNPIINNTVTIFGPASSTPSTSGISPMNGTLFINSTTPWGYNIGASIALGGQSYNWGGGNNQMTFARINGVQTPGTPAYLGDCIIETANQGALYERVRINGSGQVGIGKTNPVYLLDVNGSLNCTGLLVNGTAVSTGTGSVWGVSGSNISYTSGNVGIGVLPSYHLHVESNVATYGVGHMMKNTNATGYTATYWGSDSGGVGVIFKNGSSRTFDGGVNTMTVRNDGGDLQLQGSGGVGMMVKGTTGNVGIGITNPSGSLHINSTTADYTNSLIVNTYWPSIRLGYASSTGRDWAILNGGPGAGVGQGNFGIYDITASTYRLSINSTGNVGIGTAIPQTKLVVNNGTTAGYCAMFQGQGITAGQTGGTVGIGKTDTVNNQATLVWNHIGDGLTTNFLGIGVHANDNRLNITAAGNVGIGNTGWSLYRVNITSDGTTTNMPFNCYHGANQVLAVAPSGTPSNGGFGATNTILYVGKDTITNRSINASGTVNASGTDYAEYFYKESSIITAVINKGDIVGITSNGLLTTLYDDAITFMVKSTDPSYTGGDTWATEEKLGKRPDPLGPYVSEEQKQQYELDLAAWTARFEEERQKVDRIAFAGQVPVNVLGARPGDYIVPIRKEDGTIRGQAIPAKQITFEQYAYAVGKVIKILVDGRAVVIVKPI